MTSLPLANILVDTFLHGGIIMWPLLGLSLFALSIVGERLVWYFTSRRYRNNAQLARAYDALAEGERDQVLRLTRDSSDPRLRVIAYALDHPDGAAEIATQVKIAEEISPAQRFLGAMDTIITLAPLLGLLGTVTGIMHSFKFVGGDQELAASKVSGGIGEALIATATGLGIAIFTLVPFNVFGGKADRLESELETVAKNVVRLTEKAKQRGENGYELTVPRN